MFKTLSRVPTSHWKLSTKDELNGDVLSKLIFMKLKSYNTARDF